MENVAKGRMVSGWLREKLPVLLGWAGLGNRGPRVGHTSTPSAWGTMWLPGPLPPTGAVTSQFVEFKRSRRLET